MAVPEHLGLSLRLIRHYDPEQDKYPGTSMRDQALMLALADDREDVTTAQKIADAWTFLKSRVH